MKERQIITITNNTDMKKVTVLVAVERIKSYAIGTGNDVSVTRTEHQIAAMHGKAHRSDAIKANGLSLRVGIYTFLPYCSIVTTLFIFRFLVVDTI